MFRFSTGASVSAVRRRLIRGFGATALGPVVTAAIQLGSIPILLHTWGVAKYGDWLILSALPSYLSLSDLGFGDASGSDMTVRVASGDREGALRTFQSSWLLLSIVSIVALLFCSLCCWVIPWQSWLKLSGVPDSEARSILITLGIWVLLGQQGSLLESGYRSDGNFALGILFSTGVRLGEAVAATTVGVLTGSLRFTALTYLFTRLFGTLCYGFLLSVKSPWLKLGVFHARWNVMKKLAAPALGFIAMPAGHALSLQGFTIVIGATLGPFAVTSFATLRTLTRVNFQMLGAIAHTVWPELSAAFGAGNIPLARRLHRHAYRAGLISAFVSTILLGLAGPTLYKLWMHHAVPFNASCFYVLLCVTLANSLWYTSSVVPMSTNAHQRIAFYFLASTAASLLLARALTPTFGIVGAAAALLLIDACMLWVVLRSALTQIQDPFRSFVLSVFFQVPAQSSERGW